MDMTIRQLQKSDRAQLAGLLSRVNDFDDRDRALAIELVDIYLDNPAQKDYRFFVASIDDAHVIGYICYGPTPLTEGTYDLYWIAVDPVYGGQGVGTKLMKQVENTLKELQGRLIVIETSSSQQYKSTRWFYLKNGYGVADTIKDFYRPGEDRVTFVKYL